MRYRRFASLLALVALAFAIGRGSAQSMLPDGVFVRDSGGGIWLIIGGQRAQVPFMPATDEVIFSVPDSGQWVVQGEGGGLTLGGQPGYVFQAPVVISQPATATPVPEDPPPNVSINIDDSRLQVGQKTSITLIADDNKGISWIEWRAIAENSDDNDNSNKKSTGDPDLDANHRHDCDGRTQCAFVWEITAKVPGRFIIQARGRDEDGHRSDWTTADLRISGSAATPTPVSSPTP